MKKLGRTLKKIFFLSPSLTLLFAVFGYGSVLAAAIWNIENLIFRYLAYFSSAYALVVTITGFPHLIAVVGAVKRGAEKNSLLKRIRNTGFSGRFFGSVRFRTEVSLCAGLFINLLYIVMELISAIYYCSAWFAVLTFCYILFALMRFMLLRQGRKGGGKIDIAAEWRAYRFCGILLLLTNQVLAGMVGIIIRQNCGFHYPGVLIYAAAMYAFYALTIAVVNIVKFRRHQSPLLSSAKAVSLAAALVSMLSLTTAMLERFGENDPEVFRRTMIGCVGGGVCTMVIGMAVYMIVRANLHIKKFSADCAGGGHDSLDGNKKCKRRHFYEG